MRWMPLIAALAGCASARVENGGGGDGGNGGDDGGTGTSDGEVIDAAPPIDAPRTKTLTQNTSTAVTATAIGCRQTTPATNYTKENSYYRVFPLADHQISTSFQVTEVAFQVEQATAPAGNQPATIKLGTYAGTIGASTLNLAQVTPLASASITIPNGASSVVTPIAMFSPSTVTVPANANLIVEVLVPDGVAGQRIFYIGSNGGGETRPSYIRAPDCSVANPSTYPSIPSMTPLPPIHIRLDVTGTY